jgi:hypothetical protein
MRGELVLLEATREALASTEPERALANLDRYDSEYHGNGALAEDAAVLRVRATAATGNRAETRRLVDLFLLRFPAGTYTPEVRGMLDKNP